MNLKGTGKGDGMERDGKELSKDEEEEALGITETRKKW